ncbi:MAG: sugar ABC transporter permease [Treponema sp.]|jgi:raffinose/stachyose/melibiose transport system permease protein|nr:sugar ABC transporter permease [Treponema sp.]
MKNTMPYHNCKGAIVMTRVKRNKGLYEISLLKLVPYVFVPVILYLLVVVFPIINAGYYSLHNTMNWQHIFAGFYNYRKLVTDSIFWLALRNNFFFMFVSIIFQLGTALLVCVCFVQKKVIGPKFVRGVFFFPSIISSIVISYIWKILYNNQFGLVNGFFTAVGFSFMRQDWLANPHIVLVSIGIPLAWQFIGFYLVILLAGVTNIDPEIFDVAMMDGATGMRLFLFIVLPLLRNTINVSLIICISGSIKIFDVVYGMTLGGPGYASTVLAQYAYSVSFEQANYGYGATVSIAMLIISTVLVTWFNSLSRSRSNAE